MKVTLILMFLSLLIVNFEAFALLPEDTLTRRILSLYLQGIPSQLLEKIAIFFDIARLAVILSAEGGKKRR